MSIQVKDANGQTQTISTLDDLIAVIATAGGQGATNTALGAILTALGTNHNDEQQLHTDIGTTVHADLSAILAQDTASAAALGLKTDAKAAATDATAVSAISIWKQISASMQAAAASLAGTLGISIADGSHTTFGHLADAKAATTDATPVSAMSVFKQISASVQAAAASLAATIATAPAAGENHIGEVGGNSAVVGGSFARPANTTAYASGQLVANSATAASVQPIACAVARKNAGTGVLVGARLSKSGVSLTNASFRVHLFKTSPTTTAGDGQTFAGAVNGVAAIEIGYVDVAMDQAYADGAKGFASLTNKVFDAATGSQNIYALIEARGAYTPASGETFSLALEALRD